MSQTYLVEFDIGYKGLTLQQLLHNWLQEANFAEQGLKKGAITHLYKVVGERKVICILTTTPDGLDQTLFSIPLVKLMGEHVEIKVKPLKSFEKFATTASKLAGKNDEYIESALVKKENGLNYWVVFDYNSSDQSTEEIFKIFSDVSQSIVELKKSGTILDAWKYTGEKKIACLFCVDESDDLDDLTMNLPLMKSLGDGISTTTKSIRPYQRFQEDLKKWTKKKLKGNFKRIEKDMSEKPNLYMIEFDIEYKGLSHDELIFNWLQEAIYAEKAQKAGVIKHLYKVVGYRKVFAIVERSSDQLDETLASIPLSKLMGENVTINVKSIINFQKFATNVSRMVGENKLYEDSTLQNKGDKKGLHYWVEFDFNDSDKTTEELLKIFSQESNTIIDFLKSGHIVDGWKLVGEKKLFFLFCVETPDEMDKLSINMSFMKVIGDEIRTTSLPVRPYSRFKTDLEKWNKERNDDKKDCIIL